jgi:hypothetical protein
MLYYIFTDIQYAVEDLILWFTPKIAKFSRTHRYTIGKRVENKLHNIYEALIDAKFKSDKQDKLQILKNTNIELEKLRKQIHLLYKLKLIGIKSYEHSGNVLSFYSPLKKGDKGGCNYENLL